MYDELSSNKGLNESTASELINQSIVVYENTINKISKKNLEELNLWVGHIKSKNNYENLDNLFSTSVLTLENKVKSKKIILENLKNSPEQMETVKNLPVEKLVSVANKTLNDFINSLNEESKKTLTKILSEDENKLKLKYELLKEDVVDKLEDIKKNEADSEVLKTIDETLMLKFMEKVDIIKGKFKKIGNGNFEGVIESYEDDENLKQKLYDIKKRIDEILKGEYRIDNWGEKIVFNRETEEYVKLSNTSSGQQESIRILQDIFLNILDNTKVLRILEEPEAHLFPVAQKQLIELLALMVNQNDDNQLIITTHSPYVLTVFNNLLFANRVVEKNPSTESEVAQIIPQDSWLSAKDFSAYSLGNQSVGEDTNYCEPIFNQEKGTIQQNYLDTVSEILGGDFQALYSIHAKTFKRK